MPQKPPSAPLSFFLFFAGMLLVYWVLRTHGLQPGVPVMVANILAIAACGLVNFVVSDRMVFRNRPAQSPQTSSLARGEQGVEQPTQAVGAAHKSYQRQ